MTVSDERTLYVVTRKDLPPAVRVVMAMHVAVNIARELAVRIPFGKEHPVPDETWGDIGPPIVFMAVRNRDRLEKLAAKYDAYTYSDPDLDDGICAIALYEDFWNDNWARIAQFAEVPDE